MDISTIVGVLAAFGLVISAMSMGQGGIMTFVDVPSAIIVLGGTVGATLVHWPLKDVLSTVAVIKKAFFHREVEYNGTIEKLVRFAGRARKEGILSLQSVMNEVDDPFFLKGLQAAVDGQEPEALRTMLELEIDYVAERHGKGAEILNSMGNYAPALGMIGTLIGLVQMLKSMNDPSTIGPAMAVALITTFYGALLANLLFLPMAGKLRTRSAMEQLNMSLVVEGMKSILEGENPRLMEQKLHAYVSPKLRQSNFGKK